MVNTTKNEFPSEPTPKLSGNEEKIVDLYIKGKNLYSIAYEVFEFGGEEALEKVRQVLRDNGYLDETHAQPATRLIDEV